MTLNNFYYALSLLNELYGIDISEDRFEEIGLIAWNQIGNKRTRFYRYKACTNSENAIELPCNCDILEAVTTNFEDFQHVSNIHTYSKPGSFNTEQYIESFKKFKDHFYSSGKFIPYERIGNTLYFTDHYSSVNIVYRGVILDEDGLPEITDKEALAIAAFCAYTIKFKEGLTNPKIMQIADVLYRKWLVACDQARIPDNMSQNEWDEILDAQSNWDRKIFRKSYKPIR